ncbi:MAG: DUF4400 domain-containing protein [Rhodanobacter sp.]
MPGASKQQPSPTQHLILWCFLIALGLPMIGQTFVNTQVIKEQRMVVSWFGQDTAEHIAVRANAWYSAWALDTGLFAKVLAMGTKAGAATDSKANAMLGKSGDGASGAAGGDVASSGADTHCTESASSTGMEVHDSSGRFSTDPCHPTPIKVTDSKGVETQMTAPVPTAAGSSPSNSGGASATPASMAPTAGFMANPNSGVHIGDVFKRWVLGGFGLMYFAGYRLSLMIVWLPLLIPLMAAIIVEGGVRRNLKQKAFGGVNPMRYRAGKLLSLWCFMLGIVAFIAPGALPPPVLPGLFLVGALGLATWQSNMFKRI